MSLFYMFFTIRIILPILRNYFCILFHLILCFKVDLFIFYVIFFQLPHLFLVKTSSPKTDFSYCFICLLLYIFPPILYIFPIFYKCTIFFFRFFVIMQSPAHKEEESCLHHEPFFPELFSFYSETGMSSLYFHLKAALPEERAAHASSTAFSRRRTGSDLAVVFFVSSAKTHAKYDSCASHAEHEIFCCFSHSITCICGRCFICRKHYFCPLHCPDWNHYSVPDCFPPVSVPV